MAVSLLCISNMWFVILKSFYQAISLLLVGFVYSYLNNVKILKNKDIAKD